MASPAVKAVTILCRMLCDPCNAGRCYWLPLIIKHGSSSSWPKNLLRQAQSTVILAMCSLWRRLDYVFQSYPWLLVQVLDSRHTLEVREGAAQAFMRAEECCLDPQLGQRLRKLVTSWQDLFQDDLQAFLVTVFSRAVVTSTFVERIFSDLTHWTAWAKIVLVSISSQPC